VPTAVSLSVIAIITKPHRIAFQMTAGASTGFAIGEEVIADLFGGSAS
jgi:hypothetical protein